MESPALRAGSCLDPRALAVHVDPTGIHREGPGQALNLHLIELQLLDLCSSWLSVGDAANTVFGLVPSGDYKNPANIGHNSSQTHFQSHRKATGPMIKEEEGQRWAETS